MKNPKTDTSSVPVPAPRTVKSPIESHALIQRGQADVLADGASARYLNQAIAELNEKNYQKAIEAFKQALQHNRESAEGHFYLGLAYFMSGSYESAVSSYKMAVACEPADPAAHLNLGLTYHVLKRYDEAIPAYQRAIALSPNDAEAYSWLGSAYAACGKRREAVVAYKEAIQIKLLYHEVNSG